jgi:hypothetical protein
MATTHRARACGGKAATARSNDGTRFVRPTSPSMHTTKASSGSLNRAGSRAAEPSGGPAIAIGTQATGTSTRLRLLTRTGGR